MQDHPVWSVYDRLRSARLSVKYYAHKLRQVERANFWLDFLLLATAPSSAIAGLWFWDTDGGQLVWKFLAIPAAVAAVAKPLLHLPKRMKEYEAVLSGYRVLEYDLLEIKIAIEQKQRYDAALQSEFRRVQQRERTLIGKTPDAQEDAKVKRACQEQVLKELPAEAFFVPEE